MSVKFSNFIINWIEAFKWANPGGTAMPGQPMTEVDGAGP
jgi:hypothetical protein